jgi:hypothetical protein
MDVDNFQIAELVIHDVPLPNDEGDEVILTDAAIELDADFQHLFAIQNKSNSEGLLAVASGTIDDAGVVSVFEARKRARPTAPDRPPR